MLSFKTKFVSSRLHNQSLTEILIMESSSSQQELATFAGGCYWGVEHYFKKQFGTKLSSIRVGFSGGNVPNPTYQLVCSGNTGHAEAVQIVYNPAEVKYDDLVTCFWRIHDPTTLNRQGRSTGTQYRSSIFYHSEHQKLIAEKVLEEVKLKWKDPITTEIVKYTNFYEAHEDHQEYLDKNPDGYCSHKIYW